MRQSSRLRIVFAGTPDFAVSPLQSLLDAGFGPVAVYTQPDRPAGRGRKLQASPVKQAALDAGIRVYQPLTLKTAEARDQLKGLKPDLVVVVAYGLILPADILEIPRQGCWNIHASLLPRWRGAAPIQRAIEAGDEETGVCIMQMDAGLDTGPVMKTVRLKIAERETGGSLHDRLSLAGAEALLGCVQELAGGSAPLALPQATDGASYARKLEKNEAAINWAEPAITIERKVRAFNPWPVTWCMAGSERTRIWMAQSLAGDPGVAPGTLIAAGRKGIDVATGQGILRLLELQRPGKRRMAANDYLNAGTPPALLE
jgi:methionyl-tRNA formyltransferase